MLIIITVSLPCAGPQIRWWPDTDNVINNRNAITRSLGVYSTVQYSNAITRPGVSRVSRLFTHAGDLSIINQVSCGCGCLCIVERSKKEGDTLVFKQNTEWFHRKLCNRVASCVSISIPPQLVCSGIRSGMRKKYVECRKLTFYMIFTRNIHRVHRPCPFHCCKVSFNKTLIILCLHFRAHSSEDKRHLNTIQLEICMVLIKQNLEILSLIPGFLSSNQSRSR